MLKVCRVFKDFKVCKDFKVFKVLQSKDKRVMPKVFRVFRVLKV